MTEWIKCSDQMPKINERVLVYIKDTFTACYIDRLHPHEKKGGWAIDWEKGKYLRSKDYEVTHWMPLPKPPKDE